MMDHMLGHKANLDKRERIDIIQNVFTDYKEVKLEIKNRKEVGECTSIQKVNNPLLNHQ